MGADVSATLITEIRRVLGRAESQGGVGSGIYLTRPNTDKLLAELGYFSVDLKPHRAKREREALIKRYLEEAYDVAGLDRDEQHNIIAAKMEATKTDGVWAKSTGEYAIACRRLDNFMLRNSPAIEQSVRDLEKINANNR